MMKGCEKFVIFDLDHTLLSSNVSTLFGRYLLEKKECSRFSFILLACSYFLHKQHILSSSMLYKISFFLFFRGKSEERIKKNVDDFFQKKKAQLFRTKIKELFEGYLKEGVTLWVQSTSPDFLVEEILKEYPIQKIVATTFMTDSDGCFIKIKQLVDGEYKAFLVKEYMKEKNLQKEQVYAYTDAASDRPLLDVVGHPVCVYPDKKLRLYAKEKGWTIIDE